MKSKKKAKSRKNKITSLAEQMTGRTVEEEKVEISEEVKTTEAIFEEKTEELQEEIREVVPEEKEDTIDELEVKTVFASVIDFLSSKASKDDKFKLITFVCASALSSGMSLSFEKGLSEEVMKLSIFFAKTPSSTLAGILGCSILSNDIESMPGTLKGFKKVWMSKNGGYPNAFTAREHGKTTGNLECAFMMRMTKKCLSSDSKETFSYCISRWIPDLAFTNRGRATVIIVEPLMKAVKVIRSRVPLNTKKISKTIGEWITWLNMMLVYVLITFVLLTSVRTCFQGLGAITAAWWTFIRVIRIVYFYLFGSGIMSFLRLLLTFGIVIGISHLADYFEPKEKKDSESEIIKALRSVEASLSLANVPAVPNVVTLARATSPVNAPVPGAASSNRSLSSLAEGGVLSRRGKNAWKPSKRNAWPSENPDHPWGDSGSIARSSYSRENL